MSVTVPAWLTAAGKCKIWVDLSSHPKPRQAIARFDRFSSDPIQGHDPQGGGVSLTCKIGSIAILV
jgi:hypothetical protein